MKTVAAPHELVPGARVEIALAKTGRPPRRVSFTVLSREGGAWLMDPGMGLRPSRVLDGAACYRDGRMVLL